MGRKQYFYGAGLLAALVSWCGVGTSHALAEERIVSSTCYDPQIQTSHCQLVEDVEHRTFNWFWDNANPQNGLVPDRAPLPNGASSIASVGFALTAYGIGVERHYITREQAAERTLLTLKFLLALPQNDHVMGSAGYHGFFYHFLDPHTGLRAAEWSELSSVDTALLMSGVLFSQSYFDHSDATEEAIRQTADKLYKRVDWTWMRGNKGPWLSMGWTPPNTFLSAEWKGYNEGLIIYVLALGAPHYNLPADTWQKWTATYDHQWGEFQGHTFLNFAPLFGHQYSESWIDFRGIRDSFSQKHNTDYFQNSRSAVYAQRDYAHTNPGGWQGYGSDVWGLTASDGPGDVVQDFKGSKRHYLAYSARGAGHDYVLDDGTIAPTAAAGSIAFAPEIVLPALEEMKKRYGDKIYGKYGFTDAFNPSFRTGNSYWVDTQQIGIDQGPILLMMENWRSGLVWNVMKKNPYIRRGLTLAGFTGGWLQKTSSSQP
ncbi:Tat pathway signal protein [Saccharibacter sp. 17.LH.SD]|uniref:glucoamylase family protein n=1 Tax=Saccharibacter sp. 17.LH.SD TaxID=2689393 RepID=UPI00136CD72F|nr:glucoamylase family protein [Saccharibacter sp. 17.LH.SD]MXV44685.1 Tat pathway signal protein [Saccharibacter sp. 17.LH.SD]